MGIAIYKEQGGVGPISYDSSFSNPILWEVAQKGGILEHKYWVKMEDINGEYATNCLIYAVDSEGDDDTSWMQFARDDNGGAGEYVDQLQFDVPLGSEIPIWIKVDAPTGVDLGPKTDLKVEISYIRHQVEEEIV